MPDIELAGSLAALQPLEAGHRDRLLAAAADGELWKLRVTVVPGPAGIDSYIEQAVAGRADGAVLPFVIIERKSGRVVGSTRFWKIDRPNRKLEIGHTWLSLSAQRTGINTEVKYLMLRHAFETLDCVRVQFTTDVLNTRSRAAILRLGAKEEGIIRHERIMPDGRKRDSIRFSIIDTEWPAVKDRLRRLLAPAGP
jgi:RimJ/RimL family protein N-acetyltransferase